MSESSRQLAAPRGRYAPSPTGELHLGNASSALVAWLSVRSRGGSFVLRTEDLDPGRSRAELAIQVLDDLRWLGLDWDEGPDVGGPHRPYVQSERRQQYEQAFERLRGEGRIYPCFCSRKDIRAAASAPQEPGDELRYPGTCRALDSGRRRRRLDAGDRHAWRFRVPSGGGLPGFVDLLHGHQGGDGTACGDFVVRRSDGVAAYQLAVVVDDDAMRIGEVVRGDDLLRSTVMQLLLIDTLGLSRPVYGHVPLLLGTDGLRLSKRHRGIAIRALCERGLEPEQIVGRLAAVLGLRAEPEPVRACELIPEFDWARLEPAPGGIVVEPAKWGENPAGGAANLLP